MKTKLVYVLTCGEEGTYIEQALISAYSARYHNPDAHIVLIVDDKTNELLVGKRAEVLEYVTEKVVVDVPKEFNLMQASRWLKTSVRNIIDGDFLFIDCDTVITQSLEEVDHFECEIGAVLDSHRPVSRYNPVDRNNLINLAFKCEWDYSELEYYYSSGILYVKDNNNTKLFYKQWHEYYIYTSSLGINIDQISFERAKQNYPIVRTIDDIYNTIMYIRPKFINNARIIHFPSLDNNSFLFSKRMLQYIKKYGLTQYSKYYIQHPKFSYIPYMKQDYRGWEFWKTIHNLTIGIKQYTKSVDNKLTDLTIPLRIGILVKRLYAIRFFYTATTLWMSWIRLTGKYNPLEKYYN